MSEHKPNYKNTCPEKALFLDRDGVINIDHNYVYLSDHCDFLDGIFELVSIAKKNNYLVIVVTNQSGIGRGYYSESQFHEFMNWMNKKFGYQLDHIYFCPFHPEHGIGKYKKKSAYRKPEPGMILKAIANHNINPEHSILIGDNEKDMIAAHKAKIRTKLFLSDAKISVNCTRIYSIMDAIAYL